MTDTQQYTLERKSEANDIGHKFEELCLIYDEYGDHKAVHIKFKRWPNEEDYEATIMDPFNESVFDKVIEDLNAVFDFTIKKVFNYNGEEI